MPINSAVDSQRIDKLLNAPVISQISASFSIAIIGPSAQI